MGFTHQLRINMKVFVALAALVAVALAEPEADAGVLYGGYGYAGYSPYAYGAYGYRSYGNAAPYAYSAYAAAPYYGSYGYAAPYGLGYRGFWKRSADAEPEAEADASLLYGNYGYAAPYAYGSYGYAAPSLQRLRQPLLL